MKPAHLHLLPLLLLCLFFAQAPTGAQLKSVDLGTPVTINFTNSLPSSLNLYWVDFEGKEVFYGTLPAGAVHTQPSSAGHVWRSRIPTAEGNQHHADYIATAVTPQSFVFKANPAPPARTGLVLTDKSLGPLKLGKGSTFTTEDLLKAFPEHRVSLFVTDGLISAVITTVETYEGKKLFNLYSYTHQDGDQWQPRRRIDAVEILSKTIPDQFGVKLGMNYQDVARLHGSVPTIVRGEGGLAYLSVGPFRYGLDYPQNRPAGAPDGQTEHEILSGACKIDSILWPEIIY